MIKPAGDFNLGVTWYELLREAEEEEEDVWLDTGRAAATCCWTAASESMAAACCCELMPPLARFKYGLVELTVVVVPVQLPLQD